MTGAADAILVADLGGSSLRVAVLGRDGAPRGAAQLPLAIADEADAESWVEAFADLAGEALGAAGWPAIGAVAITGFTRTEIVLDRGGAVLRPAITFRDSRAAAEAAEIDARLGGAGAVSAYSPLARLAWLKRHEPALFARAALVLQPKDFLNFRLTGIAASDPASNAPLVGERRAYLVERLAAAAIAPALLPELRGPREMLGVVRGGLGGALAHITGAKVVVGAMDSWAATLGLGAHRPGAAYNLSGTTEVTGLMLAARARAPGLLAVAWDEGLFQLGGPSQAGADCLAWCARLIGLDPDQAARAAASVDAEAELPLFLPYLAGERVPFWDPGLRGRIVELGRDCDGPMLARAVMEGVAFHVRLVLERAAAAARHAPASLLIAGGGASDAWCAIKADALGLVVERPAIGEAGLRGCLLLAGGAPPTPRIDRFAPVPARRAALDRRHARFAAEIARMRGSA